MTNRGGIPGGKETEIPGGTGGEDEGQEMKVRGKVSIVEIEPPKLEFPTASSLALTLFRLNLSCRNHTSR